MTIASTADELTAALRTVVAPGFEVYPDIGPAVSPPGAVLGAPTLQWETPGVEPTSARWSVFLIVPAGDRASRELWDLIPPVTAALDQVADVAVMTASPSSYPTSGGDLPAYEIQIEVSL